MASNNRVEQWRQTCIAGTSMIMAAGSRQVYAVLLVDCGVKIIFLRGVARCFAYPGACGEETDFGVSPLPPSPLNLWNHEVSKKFLTKVIIP
jgi:hypothetical protein